MTNMLTMDVPHFYKTAAVDAGYFYRLKSSGYVVKFDASRTFWGVFAHHFT